MSLRMNMQNKLMLCFNQGESKDSPHFKTITLSRDSNQTTFTIYEDDVVKFKNVKAEKAMMWTHLAAMLWQPNV